MNLLNWGISNFHTFLAFLPHFGRMLYSAKCRFGQLLFRQSVFWQSVMDSIKYVWMFQLFATNWGKVLEKVKIPGPSSGVSKHWYNKITLRNYWNRLKYDENWLNPNVSVVSQQTKLEQVHEYPWSVASLKTCQNDLSLYHQKIFVPYIVLVTARLSLFRNEILFFL